MNNNNNNNCLITHKFIILCDEIAGIITIITKWYTGQCAGGPFFEMLRQFVSHLCNCGVKKRNFYYGGSEIAEVLRELLAQLPCQGKNLVCVCVWSNSCIDIAEIANIDGFMVWLCDDVTCLKTILEIEFIWLNKMTQGPIYAHEKGKEACIGVSQLVCAVILTIHLFWLQNYDILSVRDFIGRCSIVDLKLNNRKIEFEALWWLL